MKLVFAICILCIQLFAQDPNQPRVMPNANMPGTPVVEPIQNAEDIRDLMNDIMEDYTYSSAGKRDPFQSYVEIVSVDPNKGPVEGPVLPLQRYNIEQLNLVGIIWGGKKPMAMIVDETKKVYYVQENDRIGNAGGYIAKIRESEVVILELYKDINGNDAYRSRLMKIQKTEKKM